MTIGDIRAAQMMWTGGQVGVGRQSTAREWNIQNG
jgi:hypothetical protein